ncbi:MAG: VOC family protein [Myxococcales bacterium]|nr:VOC family protein [Myxococcales bacterium]
MSNPITYAELHSTKPDSARDFYAELFAWRTEPAPGPDGYTMLLPGDGISGGLMQSPDGRSSWVPYIAVESLEAAIARAKKLGGRQIKDITLVPEMGRFSLFADPGGATFGIWQCLQKDGAK